ncbi:N-acetyltransferase esco2 [Chytridiales sp. JEL 0842]|nr:N-acetyltransferase esco2 [Chytridiales sp. JEL 0842]
MIISHDPPSRKFDEVIKGTVTSTNMKDAAPSEDTDQPPNKRSMVKQKSSEPLIAWPTSLFNNNNTTSNTNLKLKPAHVTSKRPPPVSKALDPPHSKKKYDQMVLDLGQKNAGLKQCGECGMSFSNTSKEDGALHVKYHSSVVHGIDYPGYAGDIIAWEEPGTQIIHLNMKEAQSSQKKKVLEVLDVVEQELGAVKLSESFLAGCQIFLCVMKKKVVGCVVGEHIEKAFKILTETNGALGMRSSMAAGNGGTYYLSEVPSKGICGVSRIWVSRNARRRGIGTKLLDALRRKFIFGCIIDKDLLAFSQPTESGRNLAENYIGKKDILVYA